MSKDYLIPLQLPTRVNKFIALEIEASLYDIFVSNFYLHDSVSFLFCSIDELYYDQDLDRGGKKPFCFLYRYWNFNTQV